MKRINCKVALPETIMAKLEDVSLASNETTGTVIRVLLAAQLLRPSEVLLAAQTMSVGAGDRRLATDE